MSKKNRRKVETNVEVEANEVIVDMPENEETQEETEMKEKKNIFIKMGTGIGKFAGGVVKVATSTPVKVIGGVALVGSAIALGYEVGKNGVPSIGGGTDYIEVDAGSNDQTDEIETTTTESTETEA